MINGLHHVQVSCPAGSEDVLRSFYGGVLGMTELTKPPVLASRGGVWFRSGRAEIHCGVEDEFHPARKAHPGLVCTDLDAVAAACVAAGCEVSSRRPPILALPTWCANTPHSTTACRRRG